jgi:nucleoside 2-deoxyribosyltransferase
MESKSTAIKKIYLAGPDCFRADAFDHYAAMKKT